MNLGPLAPFVQGVLGVVVTLAVAELGVLSLRIAGRGAAGESPDA